MDQEENLYDVLGCSQSSSLDELKAAYQKLAKKHHPDKSSDQSTDSGTFSKIAEAWRTLKEPESRKEYDDSLGQREIEDQTLLYGTFSLRDMLYDPTREVYSHACRCGGGYCFYRKDFGEFNSYLITCDQCSLMISVDLQS